MPVKKIHLGQQITKARRGAGHRETGTTRVIESQEAEREQKRMGYLVLERMAMALGGGGGGDGGGGGPGDGVMGSGGRDPAGGGGLCMFLGATTVGLHTSWLGKQ